MKKLLLLFTLLLNHLFTHAQNYQCLQSGVKHFFVNSRGYVRGIRIDSAKITAAGDSIFYPYRTMRANGYRYDTSGCWLGKTVVGKADGTFLFDNRYGDTVTILTQAGLGTTWTFQRYGSKLYTATVVGLDTMPIFGVWDSIKRINIAAYRGTVHDTNDSMDGAEIIISKNFGFVQVFDLFMFPYNAPGGVANDTLDMFVKLTANDFQRRGPNTVGKSTSTFTLFPFHYPTTHEIYDFNVGDAFCSFSKKFMGTGVVPLYETRAYDSVIGKTIVDPQTTMYEILHWYESTHYSYPTYGPPTIYTNTSLGGYSLRADTAYVFYYDQLPEEAGFDRIVYFYQGDTSRGVRSDAWKTFFSSSIFNFFEENSGTYLFKRQFPCIRYDTCLPVTFMSTSACDYSEARDLIYSNKTGIARGTSCRPDLSGVPNILQRPGYGSIYPNPSTGTISLNTTNNIETLQVKNLLGEIVWLTHPPSGVHTFDLSSLIEGTYILSVDYGNGMLSSERLVIVR